MAGSHLLVKDGRMHQLLGTQAANHLQVHARTHLFNPHFFPCPLPCSRLVLVLILVLVLVFFLVLILVLVFFLAFILVLVLDLVLVIVLVLVKLTLILIFILILIQPNLHLQLLQHSSPFHLQLGYKCTINIHEKRKVF